MTKILLTLLVIVSPVCAGQIQLKFDPNATKVEFTLGDTLHEIHGTFQMTSGQMWIDPATGAAGGQLVVSAESGESGSHGRDSRMKKNVLQANAFPRVVFTPDHVNGKINRMGDSDFQVHGQFSIHGGTHEVTMNAKAHVESDHFSSTATFDVPYVKWGMPNPSTFMLKVSESVKITVDGKGVIDFGPAGGTQ